MSALPGPREGDPGAEEPLLITPAMLVGSPRRERVDFERGMRLAPVFLLTLIAANLAAFAWELGTHALADREAIVAAGALARDEVLAGEWWRLLSAMFLHAGPDHLIGNMLALYVVGIGCEHALGMARTAVVYVTSGITGALLSMAMGPGPAVGASGAIFGVVAALVVVLVRYREHFHVRDKRIGVVLAIWSGYQLLIGLATPLVDNFAHLGGLTGGALVALRLRPVLLPDGPRE